MSDNKVGGLHNYGVVRIAPKDNIVAVAHVLESDVPIMRQTSINPLAVMVFNERTNALIEDSGEPIIVVHCWHPLG